MRAFDGNISYAYSLKEKTKLLMNFNVQNAANNDVHWQRRRSGEKNRLPCG